MKSHPLSRRDFLKLAGLGTGSLALSPLLGTRGFSVPAAPQVPAAANLQGRVLNKLNVMSAPNPNASIVKIIRRFSNPYATCPIRPSMPSPMVKKVFGLK